MFYGEFHSRIFCYPQVCFWPTSLYSESMTTRYKPMATKTPFQIYHETKKFGKAYNIRVVCAYGGGSLWEQCKACEEGAEIIVATPVSFSNS